MSSHTTDKWGKCQSNPGFSTPSGLLSTLCFVLSRYSSRTQTSRVHTHTHARTHTHTHGSAASRGSLQHCPRGLPFLWLNLATHEVPKGFAAHFSQIFVRNKQAKTRDGAGPFCAKLLPAPYLQMLMLMSPCPCFQPLADLMFLCTLLRQLPSP